jgi:hypothetical protein
MISGCACLGMMRRDVMSRVNEYLVDCIVCRPFGCLALSWGRVCCVGGSGFWAVAWDGWLAPCSGGNSC